MGRNKTVLSDEHRALLGQIYDCELAAIAGVSVSTIGKIRAEAGIPRCSPKFNKDHFRRKIQKKYPGMYEMLGNKTDALIGNKYSISRERVRQYRNVFNIDKPGKNVLSRLSNIDCTYVLDNLGKVSDKELSKISGVSCGAVRNLRLKYNIPAYKSQEQKRRMSTIDSVIDRLGVDSDRSIAIDINVPTGVIRRRRIKLGIKAVPTQRWDYAGWKEQAG